MEAPEEDVLRFILTRIDTVPQIEALLLLWEIRPGPLTPAQVAERLYVPEKTARQILRALSTRKLVARTNDRLRYAYDTAWDPTGEFMRRVAATYQRHLIRVATMIHGKAAPAVLEFARAFAPKKES
jgi:DNA-binding IclR family transcriptional regulator